MHRIRQEIHIDAAPETVFNTLSTSDGLSKWWTEDATAEPVVGSIAEFAFNGRAIVVRFQVDELDRRTRIRRYCIGGPDEYIGSRVVFELTEAGTGTVVRFEHAKLTGSSQFVSHARDTWKRVLASLKSYAETGVGNPVSMSARS